MQSCPSEGGQRTWVPAGSAVDWTRPPPITVTAMKKQGPTSLAPPRQSTWPSRFSASASDATAFAEIENACDVSARASTKAATMPSRARSRTRRESWASTSRIR